MNASLDEITDVGFQRPGDPVEIRLARQRQHGPGFAAGTGDGFFGAGGKSLDAARGIDAIPDGADRR
jgi:hypothetical protein